MPLKPSRSSSCSLAWPVASSLVTTSGNWPGASNLVTLDMGGTSCDVGLVRDGKISHSNNFEIEWGLPVATPTIDLTTIGAGGGSIAWIDKGGLLRVGPQSAGALPGPVCYDTGGENVTVTDANLALGRLNPEVLPRRQDPAQHAKG